MSRRSERGRPRREHASGLQDRQRHPTPGGAPVFVNSAHSVTLPNMAAVRSEGPIPQNDATLPLGRTTLATIPEPSDDDVPTAVKQWLDTEAAIGDRNQGALIRVDGRGSGMSVMLDRQSMQVGRSKDADIRLDDEGVSRFHATIHQVDGVYEVVDLNSVNGTVVQGKQLRRHRLVDGDLIHFGPRVSFRFTLMDERQAEVLQNLYETSIRDALTGAYNRKHLEERLRAEIAFAVRHDCDVSALMFDLDHFKSINDTHGHAAGDTVLKFVAAMVNSRLRTEDVFARYGGEEFVVVLRGVDLKGAARAGERLRSAIAATCASHQGTLIPVSMSAGCSALSETPGQQPQELLSIADRRLYRAKRGGRNRIVATDT